ncbi:MAG: Signal transduction histidine kinase involved in nitrogen fixation and metabolism regulation [Panacagrimonas sp.]|nr:Signal transduction histidine kinase involved in nitrogen fixation and metabolism regulation [Panacagrimonas sp.]
MTPMETSEIELLRRELERQKAARRQAEQLLEQKSLELYERNRELVREVVERRRVEKQLREKAEQLAHSNAELEQFAYVASHDLKAPLRSVAGFSQLLARRYAAELDDDGQEFVAFIESGVRRMQSLIDDLLEYARASRVPLAPAWIDSRALVEDVRTRLRARLQEADAQIVLGDLPRIRADRTQLGQVLQNLIDNAVKFQAPGVQPRVEVTCTPTAEGWEWRITDNGIGIPQEYESKVFMLFQRLHVDDQYEGTGLGLPICKKIVERHGGTIRVQPAPRDSGSTFIFTLAGAAAGN